LVTQTRDQNRRPIFVVADLDGDESSRLEVADLRLEIAGAILDLSEAVSDLSVPVENRRCVGFFDENFRPPFEQWVFKFHRLRKVPGRLHSALIFDE
jgi:hypothetical protein